MIQCLLQAGVVRTVPEPMHTYVCSIVVYIAGGAMYTVTIVFSGEYMLGHKEMATRQQYASCMMNTAAVFFA